MRAPVRRRRAMMISAAVGISSVMTALAQPNQPAVPAGLLCMVQSWTWLKEAAPAIRPPDRTMVTRRPSGCRAGLAVALMAVITGLLAGCVGRAGVGRR